MSLSDAELARLVSGGVLDPRSVLRAIEKFEAEQSLYSFVELMWPIVEPANPFVPGWVLEGWCEHLEAVSSGQITRLLGNVPPGTTKALCDDTPVLTTWGWRRHGDLKAGDYVYGPDGEPKKVFAVTEPWVAPTYLVRFDDGAEIVAAGDHLWAVDRDYPYAGPGGHRIRLPAVVQTDELVPASACEDVYAEDGKRIRNIHRPDRIALSSPINCPPQKLLIDPYILGIWLGDGTTSAGCITAGEEDVSHFLQYSTIGTVFEPDGVRSKKRVYRLNIENLQTQLRLMGILGNKHIPDEYLLGSVEQRWELLRGLMDTDGCATAEGTCQYVTKLPELGEQVHYLCRSLGLKSTIRDTYSSLNGVRFGPYKDVCFTAPTGAPPIFKLERKQARLKGHQSIRTRVRYVASVEPASERSVRCITVDGGLYLVGRALVTTHNSLATAVMWPAWEWGPKKMPHLRYLCTAYGAHLTERDNRRFRAIITNDLYRALWGDVFAVSNEQVGLISNDKTGWKLASSVGGVLTGERADRLIVDDGNRPPTDEDEGESSSVMKNTAGWYRMAATDRLNSLKRSAIINIQQRLSELDISGTILDLGLAPCAEQWEPGDYVHYMVPMEYDPYRHCVTVIGWEDPRGLDEEGARLPGLEIGEDGSRSLDARSPIARQDGALAWPERFGAEELEKLRTIKGVWAWAGQYQQAPAPSAGGIILAEWWRLWASAEFPDFGTCIASLDTAYKEGEQNDYNALTVWASFQHPEFEKPKLMLRAAWKIRTNLPDLARRVIVTCREHKVDTLLIEDKTRGIDVQHEIWRLLGKREMKVELMPVSGDKVARLNAVSSLFENGVIYAPDKEWADEVIKQVLVFPHGRFDDYVDSVSQALKYLRINGVALRSQEHEEELRERRTYRKASKALYDV